MLVEDTRAVRGTIITTKGKMAGLFDLTDKTVVATGATRGIGQSMTIGLAELGADVISLQVYLPLT